MSETTEPDGKPAPEPEPVPDTPAPPAPETDETAPAKEAEEAREKEDRRTAALRARLGAAERAQDAQRAELEYYRRQIAAQAPQEETPEQRWERMQVEADARAEEKLLTRRFHEEGAAAFPDWKQRCDDLVKMGADAQIAKLLVDTPGGVKIAAALAEDPATLERIANIQSPHGRAVALGRFAATLDADDGAARAPRAAPQVTRTPAPIRPVTGRASPQFNEYTAPPEQLVDFYLKRDLERARGGSRR